MGDGWMMELPPSSRQRTFNAAADGPTDAATGRPRVWDSESEYMEELLRAIEHVRDEAAAASGEEKGWVGGGVCQAKGRREERRRSGWLSG
jgi:hypothetical protein